MSSKGNRNNKNSKSKRKARKLHPLDRDRLIMDDIYQSKDFAVQSFYHQVIEEEDAIAAAQVARGESWSVSAYLDRVHMRMGQRFFHLLSPVMQQRFQQEYPAAVVGILPFSSAGQLGIAV